MLKVSKGKQQKTAHTKIEEGSKKLSGPRLQMRKGTNLHRHNAGCSQSSSGLQGGPSPEPFANVQP